MANFHVPFFEGLNPKKESILLKDTEATHCVNARLDRGHLEAWRGPRELNLRTAAGASTIYKYSDVGWLFWTDPVDVVSTPVIDDAFERIYYTGSGDPKYTWRGNVVTSLGGDGTQSYQSAHSPANYTLGVPAPGTSTNPLKPDQLIEARRKGEDAEDPNAQPVNRYYAYSFKGADGREGPLSAPSILSTNTGTADTTIKFTDQPRSGGAGNTTWTLNPGTKRRLYRVGDDKLESTPDIHYSTYVAVTSKVASHIKFALPLDLDWESGEHFVTPNDTLVFVYNGTQYTATLDADNSILALNAAITQAVDSNGVIFGSDLLTASVKDDDDNGYVVTIMCKGSNDITSGEFRRWTRYYFVAEIDINTYEYTDSVATSSLASQYVYPAGAGQWLNANGDAIPRPQSAPLTEVNLNTAAEATTDEFRSYVFTYLTDKMEEGPPSTPTPLLAIRSDEDATISFTSEAFSELNYNLGPGSFRRLYRTGTGTTSSNFQFVKDIPWNELTTTDDVRLGDLGEVLPSMMWDPPPNSKSRGIGVLSGMTRVVNGYLAGFSGNVLCFSEQFIPHAWPVSFRMSFEEDIVGLGVTGNSLVVLTESYPYLVTGGQPDEMSAVRVESSQACVSKASIVDVGGYLVYASPDGLMGVSEAGVQNLTSDIFTRDQWQAYNPETLQGLYYEDRYIGSTFDVATDNAQQFIIDREGTLTDLDLDFSSSATTNTAKYIKSGYNDLVEDNLYLLDDDGVVWTFNHLLEPALSHQWESKNFHSPVPISIGVVRIEVEDALVAFELYRGSIHVISRDIFPGVETFRTPGGTLSSDWSFRVSGKGVVKFVTLAPTTSELSS
jgi:hypothetical protein